MILVTQTVIRLKKLTTSRDTEPIRILLFSCDILLNSKLDAQAFVIQKLKVTTGCDESELCVTSMSYPGFKDYAEIVI